MLRDVLLGPGLIHVLMRSETDLGRKASCILDDGLANLHKYGTIEEPKHVVRGIPVLERDGLLSPARGAPEVKSRLNGALENLFKGTAMEGLFSRDEP